MKGFLRSKPILSLVTVVIIATALLIALAGNAIHSWAAATDLYVNATTGNDSNSGSQSAPFATISHAITVANSPGTTVHVAPGTYTESTLTVSQSGTATAPITFVSDVRGGAKIADSSWHAWNITGSYITIQGFEVYMTDPNYASSIFDIQNDANNVSVIDNYVHDVDNGNGAPCLGGSAINSYNGTGLRIIGNRIAHAGPGTCNHMHGAYVGDTNAYIANNIISDVSGFGITLWPGGSNSVIVNNDISNARTGGIDVSADTGYTTDNVFVANNIVRGGYWGIHEHASGTVGPHNTYTNNDVIEYGPGGAYDLVSGATPQNPFSVDPQYVSYNSSTGDCDCHLRATSPIIDKGKSQDAPGTDFAGNLRPQGAGYDTGSYEYGSSSPTPTPTPTPATPTPTPATPTSTPTSATPTPTPATPTPTPQPGGETISLRAAASANNDTGGSALTIGLPAGTQSGDVMIALVVVRTAGNTITAPAGWKLVLRQGSAASISTASYVHVAGSSEPASYTWSFETAGQASGGIASYTGVDTTTPVDAAHAQYNRLSSNVDNSGVTTTTANDMLVYAVGVTTATTVNVPAGFSQQWQTTSSSSTTSEMSQQSYSEIGDTGPIHGTHNGGDSSNITHLIALKPAGVAAAVTPALIASTQKPLPVADSLPLTASIKQCCSPRPHPV
jgi:Right handed beta helix region/Protein of unknown function (DUF1565)